MSPGARPQPDFRTVFEAGPGLYLLLSPDFDIVAVTDAYCRALGRSRDSLVGRNVLEAFPPDPSDPDRRAVADLEASLRQTLARGLPDLMEIVKYDALGDDGGRIERYWSPLNVPVVDKETGEVIWIIHEAQDVTELVRARDSSASAGRLAEEQAAVIRHLNVRNEALARQIAENERLSRERERAFDAFLKSEMRFKTLADSLPGVVHRSVRGADGSRRNVFISAGVEKLLGVPAQEFMENRAFLSDFMDRNDRDLREAALKRAVERGETAEFEARMIPRQGGVRWWRVHTTPTRMANGDIQWDGFAIDVTERKAAEHNLQQALKMEAIGQLTGGLAHDFNNLLSVILSNAETLSETLADDEELHALADMTRRAAERGAELTNGLLAFARRQPLEPRPVDVNRLVVGMDGLLRRSLGGDIEIELVRGAGLWPAMVDPAQLEAALLNLALNARDAMPKGGRLTIETGNAHIDDDYAAAHAEVSPGQYVMVCVTDTGAGMEPEVAERAFEPFFTTKGPGKGAGLGLAMVYGFVKQSRGHVKIYSEPGQGTAIRIYLPRAAPAEASAEEDDRRAADGVPGGTESILLVEDDPLVRENAERILKNLGYRVLSADRGASALAILERGDPVDLLFTDVVMPGGIAGPELAARAAELRPGIRVLFTSGYTESAVVHHGRLDPGVNLIRKPYGRKALARKLRQTLDEKGGANDG
ncbi:hybrid sensor histidine kinase/response regulator [Amphiplicatus metriothermophilus]|uniref:histidine kinase n=1 Tax=Amphiplicatus metriothermophilus TaxID=1519374 RepID=A0A239PP97_9PROT|nr:ATP-binding protein [Amphiplicatus metriothermophilus]MBB5518719.1 PAS domain S-box-containing protein [Amphiplicatus metriothermophilus]SNT72124.1 PAS domain S-box-containing protein [Amphiplicatus metriothermophilus]